MSRLIDRLTVEQVETITADNMYADGGNLYLRVAGGHKYWVFRYASRLTGKDRQFGIGSVHTFSLNEAREKARALRQMLADGMDPIDHRHGALSHKSRKKKAAVRVQHQRRMAQQERIIAEAKMIGGPVMTGRQVRSARALAQLTQDQLAVMAGICKGTITLVERSNDQPVAGKLETKLAIIAALRRAGVALIDNEGIERYSLVQSDAST